MYISTIKQLGEKLRLYGKELKIKLVIDGEYYHKFKARLETACGKILMDAGDATVYEYTVENLLQACNNLKNQEIPITLKSGFVSRERIIVACEPYENEFIVVLVGK